MRSVLSNQTRKFFGRINRRFGSGHHDAHHHEIAHASGPYAPKAHHGYPSQAYPFGRKPGQPLEGWEYITFGVYIVGFAIGAVALSNQGVSHEDDFRVRAFDLMTS